MPEARKLPEPDALGALQAIALASSNPQAMQIVIEERRAQTRAREGEILQEQRLIAAEDAQKADRKFRAGEQAKTRTAIDKRATATLEQNADQFDVSTGLQKQRDIDTAAHRAGQVARGVKQDSLTAEFRQKELALRTRQENRADLTQLGQQAIDTRKQIASLQEGFNQGLPDGVNPIELNDIFGTAPLGTQLQAFILQSVGAVTKDGAVDQPARDAAAVEVKKLMRAIKGTDLDLIALEQSGGAVSGDDLLDRIMNTITTGVSAVAPQLRAQFLKDLGGEFAPLTSAKEKLSRKQLTALTLEESVAYIEDVSNTLLGAVVSNDEFGVGEQKIFAAWWGIQEDKKASLQEIIAVMADKAAVDGGFDDVKRAQFNTEVFAALNNIISMDDFDPLAAVSIPLPVQDDRILRGLNADLRAEKARQQAAIKDTSLGAALAVQIAEDNIRRLEGDFLKREEEIARSERIRKGRLEARSGIKGRGL